MINPDKKISNLKYQPIKTEGVTEPVTQEMKDMVETIKKTEAEEQANFLKQKALSEQASVSEPPKKKGKLLIQIDGLSYDALKEGIEKGYTPNMKALLDREKYVLKSFLCGLPAVTIPVQSQLFYGLSLPGNDWYNKEKKSHVSGFLVENKLEEEALRNNDEGILKEGSAFSSPLVGGSDDSAFTVAGLKKHPFKEFWRDLKTLKNAKKEKVIADFPQLVVNFFKDMRRIKKKSKARELIRTWHDWTHPNSVAAGINLLEPTLGYAIKEVILKGSPVIYADFAGYDDVAHYMEPKSEEAFKALKSIDHLIGQLKETAEKSGQRDYQLIVFSDHGQTKAENFAKEFGKGVKDVILELANEITKDPKNNKKDITFVDVYSLGNLYFNSLKGTANLSDIEKKYPTLIEKMLNHQGIDMVAGREGDNVIIYGKNGKVKIGDKAEVEGENPLAKYSDVGDTELVAKQIKDYAEIQQTGDLILFGGWKNKEEVYDFGVHNTFDSIHGGLGGPQSKPFILVNNEQRLDTAGAIRAKDLHQQLKEIVEETK